MYASIVGAALESLFPQQQMAPYRAIQPDNLAPAHTWQQRLDIGKQLYPDLTPQLISISGHSVRLTFPGEWHPNGRSVLTFDAM